MGFANSFIDRTGKESGLANREMKSSNALAEDRTDLAVERTLMAMDRSLMAWVRTALSMISFGFTIFKILEEFQRSGRSMPQDFTPQIIGLFLTGMGTLSMIAGTIEYWKRREYLGKYGPVRTWGYSFVLAMIMSVTGLFFFLTIFVNTISHMQST